MSLGDVGSVASIIALAAAALAFAYRRLRNRMTWFHVYRAAKRVLGDIECSDFKPDLIIGLGRSGAMFAGWLAGNLGSIPVYCVDRTYDDTSAVRRIEFPEAGKIIRIFRSRFSTGQNRILFVEGASSSSNVHDSFILALKQAWPDCDFRSASIYTNLGLAAKIDFVGVRGLSPWPSRFPWHLRETYKKRIGRA